MSMQMQALSDLGVGSESTLILTKWT